MGTKMILILIFIEASGRNFEGPRRLEPLIKVFQLVDGDEKRSLQWTSFRRLWMEQRKLFRLNEGYFVNLQYLYASNHMDINKIWAGVREMVTKLQPDLDLQVRAMVEIDTYTKALGSFGDPFAQGEIKHSYPGKFQRYPQPEKDYQSFSLVYKDQSLDLESIVLLYARDEAEVWIVGLKALISHDHHRKWRIESRSDGVSSKTDSPRKYTQRSSPLSYAFGSTDSQKKDGDTLWVHSPHESPPRNVLNKAFFIWGTSQGFPSNYVGGLVNSFSSGGKHSINGHMKGIAMDAFRVSLSSAISSSSQGSGHDDGDAIGDVYIWGEGNGDGILGGGTHRVGSSASVKLDSLVPKALESSVVLDVQNIGCGRRHAALVTKRGEIFSWGEEGGGRLGHEVDSDVSHPKLINALGHMNIELVACGEYHTCAVTLSGDLYTWGGGGYNVGLLGHGSELSHSVPKRVIGPLEGVHVSSVSCGPWHTAVVTSSGQLFTFGDGNFGALGHGDHRSVSVPREVESLKGLRTVRAACGVWHTAAVVEVMVGTSSSSNCSSGKLFTWGDGDKGQLGHGNKEPKVVPTCVAFLVEPNFCQVACGHSLTVALTTSGHIYTMGSTVYGQLGNPHAEGKLPIRIEGKLLKNFVEEIACGAYHVAVLTSRTEVYTWGKGANGQLGHGNTDDKNSPTLVEALIDKQVKSITCGSNFTTAICLHKWLSCTDRSTCSGCQLPFNFKRKRHNCYNCGLAFCHSCSSKKSLSASMAPDPNKPYRVCENCFSKLRKSVETHLTSQFAVNRRGNTNQCFSELVEELDSRSNMQLSKLSSSESFKQAERRSSKRNKKFEFNSNRVSPIPNGSSQWAASNISKSLNPVFGSSKKFFSASVPGSRIVSRATSPISRRPSPPRSTTPTPTLSGLTSPKVVLDDAKRTNDSLSQEAFRLREQVENLTRRAQLQEVELEKATKQLKEAITIAGEETTKCRAAKEVIKLLTAQLKDMAEKLPVGVAQSKHPPLLSFDASPASSDALTYPLDRRSSPVNSHEPDLNSSNSIQLTNGQTAAGNWSSIHNKSGRVEGATRNGSQTTDVEPNNEAEWVEQDEAGVYITLANLPGGVKELKRVRFSRKRFTEREAEQWWSENQARVYEQYNVRMVDKSSTGIGNEDVNPLHGSNL